MVMDRNKYKYTQYSKTCPQCNKPFITTNKHQICCTPRCAGLRKRKHSHELICEECGKQFKMKNDRVHQRFCSYSCSGKFKSRTSIPKIHKKTCPNCYKTFEVIAKKKNIIFCSKDCLYQDMFSKKHRKGCFTKPEIKFWKLLIENKIDFAFQYKLKDTVNSKLKFYDFYLPNIDTLIEIDGIYWHGKDKTDDELNKRLFEIRKNDLIKNQLALEQNYKLIRIWEDEIDNFNFELLK